ncbi:hypothetical protein Tco_0799837 [Tanacetum coccineum]|uniref:Uncharacterized protein n=1 Tax=Tanacetum coccineum TaxID=301880 RepID=A0ABQ4ZRF4_9ASTR
MNELLVRLNIFKANDLPQSKFIVTLLHEIAFVVKLLSLSWSLSCCRLVPSCFVIFDLEPLSLSFDFAFMFEIFKYFSFSLDRLFHLAILCHDQHAHTLHLLESSLIISLDRLDILKEDLFKHEHVVMNPTSAGMRHLHLHLYMNPEIKQLAIKNKREEKKEKRGCERSRDTKQFYVRPSALPIPPCPTRSTENCCPFDPDTISITTVSGCPSSNTDVNSIIPKLAIFSIRKRHESRQHESHHRFFPVDTSLIHIESRKSPTKSLFDVGSSRISISLMNPLSITGCSARLQGYA